MGGFLWKKKLEIRVVKKDGKSFFFTEENGIFLIVSILMNFRDVPPFVFIKNIKKKGSKSS